MPAYAFWEYYFRNALAEAGHEVIETPGVDWAGGLPDLPRAERRQWLDETWSRTVGHAVSEHAKEPIDLFLGYLFPQQVEPSGVREMRKAGIPTVNFFCDNVREFTAVPQSFRDFDLHWVPEADARPLYASAGLPFAYLPMPMWVPPELRTIPASENDATVFVGSHDVLREDLLGEAVSLGLKLEIYGSGWLEGEPGQKPLAPNLARTFANQFAFVRREGLRGMAMRTTYKARAKRPREWIRSGAHPPLVGESYFTTTRNAQVVIGVNRCPSFRRPFSNPLRYSRLRDIEVPMLGACYLTEMAPGIGDLYEIGVEIETYRDAGEMFEKVALLQADSGRRISLRQKGQRRALSDHTIARSIATIARKLGIPL
ncbi:MAG TPA: glycosyltransferase [Opitutaceae bacterium]